MKKYLLRLLSCCVAVAASACMLSACEKENKESAKDLLINAAESTSLSLKNTIGLVGDKKIGSKVQITVDPGEFIDNLAGKDIKEISINDELKAKGGVIGNGLGINYDGKDLVDVDTVAALNQSDGNMYIKINDLSDKYIKVPVENYEISDILSEFKDVISTTYSLSESDLMCNKAIPSDMVEDALKNIDIKGIVSDIDGVITAVEKAIPDTDESGEKTVKKNGIEAVFETKKIKMTDEVTKKCVNAAKEALLGSENIKKVVSGDIDYEEFINNMFAPYESKFFLDNDVDKVTLYYYDGELSGLGIDNKNYFVSADTDEGYMFILKSDNEDDGKSEISLTAVPDGDKLNIDLRVRPNKGLNVTSVSVGEISVEIDGFKMVNKDIGTFNADIKAGVSVSAGLGLQLVNVVYDAKCKGDDRSQDEAGELFIEQGNNTTNLLSYQYNYEQTDASDIKLPSDSECLKEDEILSMFSDDKLSAWQDKVSDAIGVDIGEKLSEMISPESNSYDYPSDEDEKIDYDNDPIYDLVDNYGIDFFDYYNDDFTEFDMEKFLSDAQKVYPKEKMDKLKDSIKEEYTNYINDTPNLDKLNDKYGIDYWEYYDDELVNFDMDKFLSDAQKVYPREKMNDLKKEIEAEVSEY